MENIENIKSKISTIAKEKMDMVAEELKNLNLKQTMYFKDFIKSFFKVHNIPIMIYLVANLVFIFAVSYMIIFQLMGARAARENEVLITIGIVLVIAVIYFVSLVVSLSPLGEWILRMKLGCNKITDEKIINRIEPIFNEVYAKARNLSTSVSDKVRIFIQEEEETNAFAVGRKTICITTGLLNLSDDEIRGILGHEFGHLAAKDTDLNLVVNIANWLTNIAFFAIWAVIWIIKICIHLFTFLLAIFTGDTVSVILGKLTELLYTAATFICVKAFQSLWLIVGNILLKISNKESEYKADEFSYNLGYSKGLISFFKTLPDSDSSNKNKFTKTIEALASIDSTHPATHLRIERLNKLTAAPIDFENITASENEFTVISDSE